MRATRLGGWLSTTLVVAQSACAPVISTTVPARRPRSALVVDASEAAECTRSRSDAQVPAKSEDAAPVDDAEVAAVLSSLPEDVRRTALAVALDPALARLLRERALGGKTDLEVVALRLEIVTRISSLEIQLSSLAFEVGCLGRQMDAVLFELDRLERRQQLALTIGSLVAGAAAGVGAGVWQLSDRNAVVGPAALGVVGGTVTVGLGAAAFVPRRGRVVYTHARNPLTPIVRGIDPEGIYPPAVFRLLTEKRPSGQRSSRDELLEDWDRIIAEAVPARDRELAESILYGEGGMYDRNLLDAREKMLDVLESELDGIERDFEQLYRFLSRVLEDHAPAE